MDSINLFDSRTIFIIISAIIGVLFFFAGIVQSIRSQRGVSERISDFEAQFPREFVEYNRSEISRLYRARMTLNDQVEMFIPANDRNLLASANWAVTPLEFLVIRLMVVLVGFVIGWMVSSYVIVGGFVGAACYFLPGLYLRLRIRKRQLDFQNQLMDILIMITGSLKAGLSLNQAILVIVDDFYPPASVEFERVQREVSIGLSLGQALENLAKRMENEDLELVVSVIRINQQVGGNLSSILMSVVNTIRERNNMFNEIRVQTSYARFTGYMLTALPFITSALIMVTNADFFAPILEPGLGRIFLAIALLLVLLGNFVINRMIKSVSKGM